MEHRALHTEIVQTLQFERFQIIRESSFQYPEGESNIYAKNEEGKIIWFAELPGKGDCYPNEMYLLRDGKVQTATWNGFTVLLNVSNGQIIESKFTM